MYWTFHLNLQTGLPILTALVKSSSMLQINLDLISAGKLDLRRSMVSVRSITNLKRRITSVYHVVLWNRSNWDDESFVVSLERNHSTNWVEERNLRFVTLLKVPPYTTRFIKSGNDGQRRKYYEKCIKIVHTHTHTFLLLVKRWTGLIIVQSRTICSPIQK